MLARSVKRPGALIHAHDLDLDQEQENWSIDRNDRDGLAAAKSLVRRNPQQGVRPAQTVERVRFLPANGAESPVAKLAAHVMRPVAVIVHFTGEDRRGARERKLIVARSHQAK